MLDAREKPFLTTAQKQAAGNAAKSPPSTRWRVYHATCFSIGAVFFLLASPMFFPQPYSLTIVDYLAGWLYTLGSASFLVADLTEWWYFRTGNEGNGDDINFFASVVGSMFYLAGSSLFIPTAYYPYWGNLIFVVGSAVIVISQAAKLVRGRLAAHDWLEDLPAVWVDATTLVGGFWYMIGSTCGIGATGFCAAATVATMYTLGGSFFVLAAAGMQYRYFQSPSMPKATGPTSFMPFVPAAF